MAVETGWSFLRCGSGGAVLRIPPINSENTDSYSKQSVTACSAQTCLFRSTSVLAGISWERDRNIDIFPVVILTQHICQRNLWSAQHYLYDCLPCEEDCCECWFKTVSESITPRGTDDEQCPPADHMQTTLVTLEPGVNLDVAEEVYKVQIYWKGNHCHSTSSGIYLFSTKN